MKHMMKESKTIKEYSDKLLGIANKMRLLGSDFDDFIIVENFLVTMPERTQRICLSKITLTEVLHVLQAQEQQRLMREDRAIEGALTTKHHDKYFKKSQPIKGNANNQNKGKGPRKNYLPCQHFGKIGFPLFKCWKRPDIKCNKCNQLRQEAIICRSKFQQHEVNAEVVEKNEENHIFVTTFFSTWSNSKCWLIDSGYTNHMTYDKSLFKDLKPTNVSKVRIGNDISIEGKGTIVISKSLGRKIISDVLYIPNIDQNFLSVGQLIEKGFKVSFKYQHYLIYDIAGHEFLKIKASHLIQHRRSRQSTTLKSVPQNSTTRDLVIAILKEC
ncbi:hypothetical protein CR513_27213, partial [Mucuna pruriens]